MSHDREMSAFHLTSKHNHSSKTPAGSDGNNRPNVRHSQIIHTNEIGQKLWTRIIILLHTFPDMRAAYRGCGNGRPSGHFFISTISPYKNNFIRLVEMICAVKMCL